MRSYQLTCYALILILLLAFSLRVYGLNVKGLSFDEAGSAYIAGLGTVGMFAYLKRAIFEHPPLYYFLLSVWTSLAGRSEFALRYFSVLAGVLLVPLTYRLARLLSGRRVALLSAFLLTFSSFHVQYSHDARMYALLAVWGLLAIYFFVLALIENRWRWWIGFILSALLALYTHYYGGLIIVFANVFFCVNWRQFRPLLGKFTLIQLIPALLHLPWLILAQGFRNSLMVVASRGFAAELTFSRIQDVWLDFSLDPTGNLPAYLAVATLGLMALGLLIFATRTTKERPAPLGRFFLPLYLIAPFVVGFVLPQGLRAKYVIAFVPAYALALAFALDWLMSRWKVLCGLALLFLVVANAAALSYSYQPIKNDPRQFYGFVLEQARPSDALILNGPWQWPLFEYYVRPKSSLPYWYLPPDAPPPLDLEKTEPILRDILAQHPRVWVVTWGLDIADPGHLLLGWMDQHAYATINHHSTTCFYAPLSNTEGQTRPLDVNFDNQLRLRALALATDTVPAGDIIRIDSEWEALRDLTKDYHPIVTLEDQRGFRWSRRQFPLGGNSHPTWTWHTGDVVTDKEGLLVPVGTPPGEYRLRAAVHRPQDGQDVFVVDEHGTPQSFTVELGTVQITSGPLDLPPSAVSPTHPLTFSFGERLELLGYDLPDHSFQQGEDFPVTLYWRAKQDPGEDLTLSITLVSNDGHTVAEKKEPLVEQYPTSQWQSGELVISQHGLNVAPDAPAGPYQLRITLHTSSGQPLAVSGERTEPILWGLRSRRVTISEDTLDLETVYIQERPRTFKTPRISHPLRADLGDQVRFLGYDLKSDRVSPGGSVELTLYWQAQQAMDVNYTVFTQVLDANYQAVGQWDNWPRRNAYPTKLWAAGEIVDDPYSIPIDPHAPSGEYTIAVGMYDAKSGERLPVTLDNGQQVPERWIILQKIRIEP
ncbi:MAG: glycosyltransferase family 39 protein [Anaerolineae bacterium]|jgi:4-amino-4-deoxy-L-arabinose transferase-like glycosyltransferase|nr:glycosyltransferase family 39 protein [Anaerolineae bacterium]